ncbi:MAG TPA: 2-amino-4-hydroxy-6-hydroxymethyldihydropteridine diphosphokinase [Anaerolineales bacterium]|nr:2-amino-4-hydroxy-6-hydroxymethyldihydropteridine diphosphokinase [Anaerolineales bacterium]
MRRFFLSLGSNIQPERNLPAAVRLLQTHGDLVAVSSVYASPPFGAAEPQPDYLNAVLILASELEPEDFQRRVVRGVEAQLGRKRTADRFAPRPIDIDILLIDDEILEIDHRRIPSREILERSFVAIPLAEVAPDFIHPIDGRTLAEIAAETAPEIKPHPLDLSIV